MEIIQSQNETQGEQMLRKKKKEQSAIESWTNFKWS